jgi:hypothetical protein
MSVNKKVYKNYAGPKTTDIRTMSRQAKEPEPFIVKEEVVIADGRSDDIYKILLRGKSAGETPESFEIKELMRGAGIEDIDAPPPLHFESPLKLTDELGPESLIL